MATREDRLRTAVHQLKLRVAIDGPAGSGKSTVGLGLADALELPFLDTGLMYRAVAWLALRDNVASDDERALTELATRAQLGLDSLGRALTVKGAHVGPELQSRAVDAAVSAVSAHGAVRGALVTRQRQIADQRAIVMVGRDIGTVVLPDAPVKLWVTATARTRAERRLAQRDAGRPIEVVEAEIARRDGIDSTRAASPLVKAPDAVVVATDGEAPEETIRRALEVVRARVEAWTAAKR